MKYIRIALLLMFTMLVSACATTNLSGHDLDYTNEKTIPPLVMPAGMKSPVKEGFYVAPRYSETRHQAGLSLLPPGSNLGRFTRKKTHQKEG
ncbi:MAG: hypothetical protein K0U29_02570 [Gammaproteobacteria bacterium]|nr:hypothetical protein [Gammaproteobacteria bacterium]MCH9743793.1 hypothetical protein [Gammaproteobacteria bacterium]